jgi:hypothetical protein
MTALDSWALAGVLCRRDSCLGAERGRFQRFSFGALQKGQWTRFFPFDLRIGLGIFLPKSAKRVRHKVSPGQPESCR